jgi:hypothetical protein
MSRYGKKTGRILLCHAKGRVFQIGHKAEISSEDLVMVATHDPELIILLLNILVRSGSIKSISGIEARSALTYIVSGSSNLRDYGYYRAEDEDTFSGIRYQGDDSSNEHHRYRVL